MTKPYHEAANIFPMITGKEYDDLKNDIAENGLLEPIWLHPDGSILDGRNRYVICNELGIIPAYRTWQGEGSPVDFVISLNLHRRHLSISQYAACAVTAKKIEAEYAKQRQGTGNNQYRVREKIPQPSKGKSRDKAGAMFNVNGKYVDTAEKLHDNAPDLFQAVYTGQTSIQQAKREYNKRTKVEPEPIAGKYRVFYADPPWKYNDTGLDDYGHAERHYPALSIKELCDLGETVKQVCEGDAVLFLWVTSPFLESSFKVIKAWGFTYKTSFVWDKVKHNYGHYNSVRHEFLLVCTKGSCTPDVAKLYDSVQTIERSKTHSEKPEFFRAIIDELYTHGNRIELFSRTNKEGWEHYGNEPDDVFAT